MYFKQFAPIPNTSTQPHHKSKPISIPQRKDIQQPEQQKSIQLDSHKRKSSTFPSSPTASSPVSPSPSDASTHPVTSTSYRNSHSQPDVPGSSPSITIPFSASLLSTLTKLDAQEEHVTVWHPESGKTVAGNAAPHRKNLSTWLSSHPGWEEKAEELKSSSKRKSHSVKKERICAIAFSSLCASGPLVKTISLDAQQCISQLGIQHSTITVHSQFPNWSKEELICCQEGLVRMAEQLVSSCSRLSQGSIPKDKWLEFHKSINTAQPFQIFMMFIYHLLLKGISEATSVSNIPRNTASPSTVSYSPSSFPSACQPQSQTFAGYSSDTNKLRFSSPASPLCSDFETIAAGAFRSYKEARITVWDPSTGRTVSGNAAPSKKNLSAWIEAHPGWVPKTDEKLVSSTSRKMVGTHNVKPPIQGATATGFCLATEPPPLTTTTTTTGTIPSTTLKTTQPASATVAVSSTKRVIGYNQLPPSAPAVRSNPTRPSLSSSIIMTTIPTSTQSHPGQSSSYTDSVELSSSFYQALEGLLLIQSSTSSSPKSFLNNRLSLDAKCFESSKKRRKDFHDSGNVSNSKLELGSSTTEEHEDAPHSGSLHPHSEDPLGVMYMDM